MADRANYRALIQASADAPRKETIDLKMELVLVLVRVLICSVIAALAWVTYAYCTSVYFDRTRELREGLACMQAQLDQLSVPYWLDDGTLLGAARLRQFVIWDHDIDVGVEGPITSSILARMKDACGLVAHDAGSTAATVDDVDLCNPWICIRLRPHVRDEKGLSCGARHTPLEAIYPLVDCSIAHVTTKCPQDHHHVLSEAFGVAWLHAPLTGLFS